MVYFDAMLGIRYGISWFGGIPKVMQVSSFSSEFQTRYINL